MKKAKLYKKCLICKELLDDDEALAEHIFARHEKEWLSYDKRFAPVTVGVMFMITDLLDRKYKGVGQP